MKKPKANTIEELQEWYAEELKRKDDLIDRLRKENIAIMKAALNQGVKLTEFESRLKAFAQKKKK